MNSGNVIDLDALKRIRERARWLPLGIAVVVAAIGFAVGIEIAAYFMRDPPVWMTLVIALGLGILGAARFSAIRRVR